VRHAARRLRNAEVPEQLREPLAIFREVEESQRKFAERSVRWFLDTQVSSRMAYNHYFGKAKPAGKAAEKKKA